MNILVGYGSIRTCNSNRSGYCLGMTLNMLESQVSIVPLQTFHHFLWLPSPRSKFMRPLWKTIWLSFCTLSVGVLYLFNGAVISLSVLMKRNMWNWVTSCSIVLTLGFWIRRNQLPVNLKWNNPLLFLATRDFQVKYTRWKRIRRCTFSINKTQNLTVVTKLQEPS